MEYQNHCFYLHIPDEFDEDGEADPMDEPEATDRSGMFKSLAIKRTVLVSDALFYF